MHKQRRVVDVASAILVGLLLSLSLASVTAARDQPQQQLPFTPDPKLCKVEPRTVAELEAAFASLARATPEPPTPVTAATGGKVADEATVDAVTVTVIEAIACANGGDMLRFLALVSDDALPIFGDTDMDRERLRELADVPATPVGADGQTTLVAVRDVRTDDGSVSATVESRVADEPSGLNIFTFVQEDDHYVIAGISEPLAPLDATPAG